MNALAAAALAAGELICEFGDGYRKSLLAEMTGDAPRTELTLVYGEVTGNSAEVLSSRKPGRRRVLIRTDAEHVHFIEPDGRSVRVTTLTSCARVKMRVDQDVCTRFSARHAWHLDTTAHLDPDASFRRQPSGAATGSCEPWRVD
jgi:hypothetical protein